MKMKCLSLCMWSWVLLVLMGSGRSMGCSEEERLSLLKIMAAFNHPNGSSLPSWRDGNGDCCSWYGVECDNITSRVTGLDLAGTRDWGLQESGPWVIDASLFLPLEELQLLNLRNNSLSGLNGTLHLKKLKQLDLSHNHLERVPSLYKRSPVEAQNSSSDKLEGVNLEVLILGFNNLVNDALTDVMRITTLKVLDISFCTLNASSQLLEGMSGLRNLEVLNIGQNEFWGLIPSCIGNLTFLRELDIGYNDFSGTFPSYLLSNLKSLEYIELSGNAFEGSFSLASLPNTSDLRAFFLHNNHNRLEVNTEEPTWFPSFQLEEFSLSNCMLNKVASGVIPSFLKKQHHLGLFQINRCGMVGNFPDWLLDNNVNLEVFELKGNNLSGAFHLPSIRTLVDMSWFDVSLNGIDGELPSWIGSILPNLLYLDLSGNLLEGRIPSSMGNMRQLVILDLSNNSFIGGVPETLAKNCTSLQKLKLSGNNLQGQMLPRNSNLKSLECLYLENNHFTGDISPGILNSSSLRILDVSNNSLSGKLPNWIGDIQHLAVLTLSSNILKGPLPLSFCNLHNLVFLDLSSNGIGPNIPSCTNVTIMRFLHLTNDRLAGHFPNFLSGASSIITLDLRHNALSGKVPDWISSLQNLKALLLQGNNFEGSIPLDLCLVKSMTILDLSDNNLYGTIPSCLKDLTFGNYSLYASFFNGGYDRASMYGTLFELEEVNFMTKRRLESYKGSILDLMSGMDLSQNNLTGFIPPEIGHLSELRALNLSHNHLTGPIPELFSNLKEVESLDLSDNSLTGAIPPQLTKLYSLSNFRVAYNNLSGRIPDWKDQFGTFDKTSYEGNPLLCGMPLTSCDDSNHEQGIPPSLNQTREDDYWREAFLWSFVGSYVIAFLGMVLFLYLNPYYQCMLFELVRKLIPSFP